MVSIFSSGDLIRVAIQVEQRGMTFYDTMARSTENLAARQVFAELVEMEQSHVDIFQGMLQDKEKYQLLESHQPGYDDYIKSLLDTAVFTENFIVSDTATNADTDVKAVELGIRAEKDSILFYQQMQEDVPPPTRKAVRAILAQEKKHLAALTNLRKKLLALG